MTRIQQWLAGTVVAVMVIVAAGWFVAIAPQKHKAASVNSQAASQEQSNDGLRNRVTALTAQMSAVPAEEASVAAVAAKIPADPELPELRTRTIHRCVADRRRAGLDLAWRANDSRRRRPRPSHLHRRHLEPPPRLRHQAQRPLPRACKPSALASTFRAGTSRSSSSLPPCSDSPERRSCRRCRSRRPRRSRRRLPRAPAAAGAEANAWKSLEATITVSVFMNTTPRSRLSRCHRRQPQPLRRLEPARR